MIPRILLLSVAVFVYIYTVTAVTNSQDSSALISLRSIWENSPPNWAGSDPCGSGWVGIECENSRVTSIRLASMDLQGYLSGDIASLSELQILDLSYNDKLTGSIPPAIGNLKKLISLSLVGCSFTGSIPSSIGSLRQLTYLALNSNGFSGHIPPSIGNLVNLNWLDLAENQLEGTIPVSNGTTTPGLDLLVMTKHFHFGKNKLSGPIPPELFSSEMTLIHLLFESNRFNGTLPNTLGLVQSLEVVRFDNNSLSGSLPSNIYNLTNVHDLFLSNNRLIGPLPNISSMNNLNTLDISNNDFDTTDMTAWFPNLPALTTLNMQNTKLRGEVPVNIFSIPHIQTLQLSGNQLNGDLDIGTSFSNELRIVNLRRNFITDFDDTAAANRIQIVLVDNPVCSETTETSKSYCKLPVENGSSLYSTPQKNCVSPPCSSKQIASPTCRCQYPYKGILQFRGIFFSDYANPAPYASLESSLLDFFSKNQLPVDSVSVSDPRTDPFNYFLLSINIFPYGVNHFNHSAVSAIGFAFSTQAFKPSSYYFGPYVFHGDHYDYFSDNKSSKISAVVIIGGVVGGCILLLVAVLAGVYAFRQKKRAERATKESNPFATWDVKKSSGGVPQLKGARFFSFDEVRKYTNNFSESNDVGSGGYGKVYRGTLPTGELVAIKRAQQGSMQGGGEFKTEIELLSRVHHKNVVGLLGFCFDRGEQMLVYEYIPNGSLYETLSGKSGIRLDWTRRLKIALGAARGLSYLHELANPPIIHRDIKSTNILLDDRLTAKVADFGLSKPMGDTEKGHVTTQVKGTMGYLDPEYYMTQQLTEKSDVYSFGVLMLELVTGKRPIEKGKYIVREVRMAMDRTKSMYNLQQMLDPSFGGAPLKGLERFVDLAMSCVEESGAERPAMGEVVKEIESIMQVAGMNPNAESATSSSSYEETTKGSTHPYGEDSFAYSAAYSAAKIEPQ